MRMELNIESSVPESSPAYKCTVITCSVANPHFENYDPDPSQMYIYVDLCLKLT